MIMIEMPKPDCSREGYLREQEEMRADEKEWQECQRKRKWRGYETLKNTIYREGGVKDAVRWMS